MLTRKQHQLFMFLYERAKESPVSPSYEEMKQHLGLRSKSGIHRMVRALQERGFIAARYGRARSITILRSPDCQNYGALEAENWRLREENRRLQEAVNTLQRRLSYHREPAHGA